MTHVLLQQATTASARSGQYVALRPLGGPRISVVRRSELSFEGAHDPDAFLLLEGWLLEHVRLPGGERVVIDFRLPGSLVGLTGLLLGVSDRAIEALTDVVVVRLPAARMRAEIEQDPVARQRVLSAMARQEASVARRIVNVTRRSALARTAYFLCEMDLAMRWSRLGDGTYHWPLSQSLMADALGMTKVHLNRVMRELREAGLVTVAGGMITVGDIAALRRIADFEPSCVEPPEPSAS